MTSAVETNVEGLVGYVPEDARQAGKNSALHCNEGPFSVTGGVGKCCPAEGDCGIPTTCLANTLWYTDSTQRCGSASTCATLTILQSLGAASEEATLEFQCNHTSTGYRYRTVYREDPAARTEPGPTNTGSDGGSGPSAGSDGADGDAGSSSKAWIAGAVIGPVVFILLLCGVGFWVWKKRAGLRKQPTQTTHPTLGGIDGALSKPELAGSPATGAGFGGPGATGWDKTELDAREQQVAEAPNSSVSQMPELGPGEHSVPKMSANTYPQAMYELDGADAYQELAAESARLELDHGGSGR